MRKKGENEAIQILKTLGIQMDENYCDDNSSPGMPDLRYADGRGMEVTHTRHNNAIFTGLSKYNQLRPGEDWHDLMERHMKVEAECREAYDRWHEADYARGEDGDFTDESRRLFESDCKLLKKHWGYDPHDITKCSSEFGCDRPSITYSTDNIIREIIEDKGKRHPSGETDLFLFVADQEYDLMKELIPQVYRNGYAAAFLHQIYDSPFPVIYVCAWDIVRQKYNVVNPRMTKFYKRDGVTKRKFYNGQIGEKTHAFKPLI